MVLGSHLSVCKVVLLLEHPTPCSALCPQLLFCCEMLIQVIGWACGLQTNIDHQKYMAWLVYDSFLGANALNACGTASTCCET
ncbi:hypothetical protein CsSME_00030315 [Camellia sinensis var. sinensis]